MDEAPRATEPLPRSVDDARGLAVAFYLGLAPFWSAARIRRRSVYLQHHHGQALSFVCALVIFLAVDLLSNLIFAFMLISDHQAYVSIGVTSVMNMAGLLIVIGLLVVWCIGVWHAWGGSLGGVPLVGRLARYRRLLVWARASSLTLLIALVPIAAMAGHASLITRADGGPGRAYLLYDNEGFLPRWLFALGFYRIALVATERWGEGSVIVAPLSVQSLARAMRNGDFLVVASHGDYGDVYLPEGAWDPTRIQLATANPRLRFVYLCACNAGNKASEWESVFAPAQVVTFDRISSTVEHIYWLWVSGPREFVEQDFAG